MRVEIAIANANAAGRNYLTWAPVRATLRLVDAPPNGGQPIAVTVRNRTLRRAGGWSSPSPAATGGPRRSTWSCPPTPRRWSSSSRACSAGPAARTATRRSGDPGWSGAAAGDHAVDGPHPQERQPAAHRRSAPLHDRAGAAQRPGRRAVSGLPGDAPARRWPWTRPTAHPASCPGTAPTCSTSSGSCRSSTRVSRSPTGASTNLRPTCSPATSWARPGPRATWSSARPTCCGCGGPTPGRGSAGSPRFNTLTQTAVGVLQPGADTGDGWHRPNAVFDTGPALDPSRAGSTRWRAIPTASRTPASRLDQEGRERAARPAVLPAALQRRPAVGAVAVVQRPLRRHAAEHLFLPGHCGPARLGLSATTCRDTMWPWNDDTAPPRPSNAPRTPFPVVPTATAPGPTPRVGDMIDYAGVHIRGGT